MSSNFSNPFPLPSGKVSSNFSKPPLSFPAVEFQKYNHTNSHISTVTQVLSKRVLSHKYHNTLAQKFPKFYRIFYKNFNKFYRTYLTSKRNSEITSEKFYQFFFLNFDIIIL